MGGCYPRSDTYRPLERPPILAFDLLSRRSRDRDKWGDRLPPGQKVVGGWPVLTYGGTPRIDLDAWRFRVYGAVDRELELTWEQFQALPSATVTCDIHCVTSWSRMDNQFEESSSGSCSTTFGPCLPRSRRWWSATAATRPTSPCPT